MPTTSAPHTSNPLVPAAAAAILGSLSQLVWIEQIDTGDILYSNEAFAIFFGTDASRRDAATEEVRSRFKFDGALKAREILLGRCDGARRWHKVTVQALKKDDAVVGRIYSAEDVDELCNARQILEETVDLLRLSHEAAGAGLFDFRVAGQAVLLSRESARQHGLGANKPAVAAFRGWLRCVHAGDRRKALETVKAAIAGHHTFDIAFRVHLQDDDLHWIQAIGRPSYDSRGALTRITGLSLDISARKEAERALIEAKSAAEEAQRSAQKANSAKTEFLSTMSHEIRTPLNAMIGFAGLIASSQRLDPELQHYAELVRVSGKSLLSVVNDILDFSSVEAGAVSLRNQTFSLDALVEGSMALIAASASGKALGTATILDRKLPRHVVGDEGRLRQVLLNLLNNAIKFTQRGSITVSVSHEGRTPWGERIRISVADTGIGIPEDKQESLFERFYQVDGSMRRDHGGTGLGLAISRGLIERMGGEIGVISRIGQGSTFWFTVTLPIAQSGSDAAAPRENPVPCAEANILLVEDIDVNRELACVMLRAAGHNVDVAENGFAAVRAVEAGDYDLVLMDIQMPGMDGMMATRLIRCLPGPCASVPIIALTANVLPDQVLAYREAGLDDHLGKPFSSADLDSVIARWLAPGSDQFIPPTAAPAQLPLGVSLDRKRYKDNLVHLAPETLAKLLMHLCAMIDSSFRVEPTTPACRESIRREAHALAGASGLIGFVPLSAACTALESVSESGIAEEGPAGFDIALSRARALAVSAAFETRRLIADMQDHTRSDVEAGAVGA